MTITPLDPTRVRPVIGNLQESPHFDPDKGLLVFNNGQQVIALATEDLAGVRKEFYGTEKPAFNAYSSSKELPHEGPINRGLFLDHKRNRIWYLRDHSVFYLDLNHPKSGEQLFLSGIGESPLVQLSIDEDYDEENEELYVATETGEVFMFNPDSKNKGEAYKPGAFLQGHSLKEMVVKGQYLLLDFDGWYVVLLRSIMQEFSKHQTPSSSPKIGPALVVLGQSDEPHAILPFTPPKHWKPNAKGDAFMVAYATNLKLFHAFVQARDTRNPTPNTLLFKHYRAVVQNYHRLTMTGKLPQPYSQNTNDGNDMVDGYIARSSDGHMGTMDSSNYKSYGQTNIESGANIFYDLCQTDSNTAYGLSYYYGAHYQFDGTTTANRVSDGYYQWNELTGEKDGELTSYRIDLPLPHAAKVVYLCQALEKDKWWIASGKDLILFNSNSKKVEKHYQTKELEVSASPVVGKDGLFLYGKGPDNKYWMAEYQPGASYDIKVIAKPVLAGNLMIYSSRDYLHCEDLLREKAQWKTELSSHGVSDIAVGQNTIFFIGNPVDFGGDPLPGRKNGLVALDPVNGKMRTDWTEVSKSLAAEAELGFVAVEDGVLIVANNKGIIHGYKEGLNSQQESLWISDVSSTVGKNFENVKIAAADEAIFLCRPNVIVGINVHSGYLRWKEVGAGGAAYKPIVTDGMVIGAWEEGIVVYDLAAGKKRWQFIPDPDAYNVNAPSLSRWGDLIYLSNRSDYDAVEKARFTVLKVKNGSVVMNENLMDLVLNHNLNVNLSPVLEPVVSVDPVTYLRDANPKVQDSVWLSFTGGGIIKFDFTRDAERNPVKYNYKVEAVRKTGKGKWIFSPLACNGKLHYFDVNGTLQHLTYGKSKAQTFSGDHGGGIEDSYRKEYARVKDDFTLECWVRTQEGGQILYQQNEGSKAGFSFGIATRKNKYTSGVAFEGQGSLQFAVFSDTHYQAAQTAVTPAADGNWHHVAVRKSGSKIDFFVDGMQYKAWYPENDPNLKARISRTSTKDLWIGFKFLQGGTDDYPNYFNGLLKELRMWSKTFTAQQLHDLMSQRLGPMFPDLVGYWPLDENCDNQGHSTPGPDSIRDWNTEFVSTNLTLSDKLWPYLDNHIAGNSQFWPYTENWISYGAAAVSDPPVLANETLCYRCDGELYGIDRVHGSRRWGLQFGGFISAPIALRGMFYIVANDQLWGISADSGKVVFNISLDVGEIKYAQLGGMKSTNSIIVHAEGVEKQVVQSYNANDGNSNVVFPSHKVVTGMPMSISGKSIYYVLKDKLISLEVSEGHARIYEKPLPSDVKKAYLWTTKDWVFCFDGLQTLLKFPSNLEGGEPLGWENTDLPGMEVVGLTGSANANRIFVSTTDGSVIGIDYGSGSKQFHLSDVGLDDANLSSPFIHENEIWLTGGKNGKGCLRAFDMRTGDLRADFECNALPTTDPMVYKGNAWFGTHSGGLIAVLVGNNYALKLEPGDHPIAMPYDKSEFKNIKDVYAVETWVKVKDAGIICVKRDDINGPAFSLEVEEDGKIKFIGYTKDTQKQLHAQSPETDIIDGKWHFISIVVKPCDDGHSPYMAVIYLDGKVIPSTKNETLHNEPAFLGIANSLEIGGYKNQTKFKGLIHELRVWSTWLHNSEVSDRMHVKLAGTEPNLAMYMDFGTRMVRDEVCPESKHENGSPKFWLTALDFHPPKYPFITSNSREPVRYNNQEHPQKSFTEYQTELKTIAASGMPRKTGLTLVADKDCEINGNPQKKGEKFTLSTGSDGKSDLAIKVMGEDKQAPEIKITTDYMYPNESFYLSPAFGQQKTITVSPTLDAHVQLMQDYRWKHGDKMGKAGSGKADPKIDSASYFTTITLSNTLGQLQPNETLELTATDWLLIHVKGKPYMITPSNPQRFRTNASGELIVEIKDVQGLVCPKLVVHVAKMPYSNKFVVDPVKDPHQVMSHLTGKMLLGKKATGTGRPKLDNPIVSGKRAGAAKGVAKGVRMAMKAANKLEITRVIAGDLPTQRELVLGIGALAPKQEGPNFVTMVQSHHEYHNPVTPEFLEMPFILSFAGNDPRYPGEDVTSTLNKLDDAQAREYFPHEYGNNAIQELGWSPGSIIHHAEKWVKKKVKQATSAVTKGFSWLKKNTEEVVHHIAAAVKDFEGHITHMVLHTLDDIIKLTVRLFHAIAVLVKELIAFLKMLFGWGNIKRLHKIVAALLGSGVDFLKPGDLFSTIKNSMDGEFDKVKGWVKEFFSDAKYINGNDKVFGQKLKDWHLEAPLGHFKEEKEISGAIELLSKPNAKYKYIEHKLLHAFEDKVHLPLPASLDKGAGLIYGHNGETVQGLVNGLVSKVKKVAAEPLGILSLSTQDIIELIREETLGFIDLTEDLLNYLIQVVEEAISKLIGFVEDEIDIPFLSELYKMLIGDSLSILDLTALFGAVFMNFFVAFASEVDDSFKLLTDLSDGDVDSIVNGIRGGSLSERLDGEALGVSKDVGNAASCLFMALSFCYGILQGSVDFWQGATNSTYNGGGGMPESNSKSKAYLKIVTYLFQIGVTVSQTLYRDCAESKKLSKIYGLTGFAPAALSLIFAIATAVGRNDETYHKASLEIIKIDKEVDTLVIALVVGILGMVGSTGLAVAVDIEDDLFVSDPLIPNPQPDDYVEIVMSGIGFIPTALNILIEPEIIDDSEGVSVLVLTAADIAIFSMGVPLLHDLLGYRKRIVES